MEALYKAAEDRLKSQWPAGRVYTLGDVPSKAISPYVVLSLSTPAFAHDTNDANPGPRWFRLVAQCVGRTDGETSRASAAVQRAYIGHRLVVPGHDVGPPDPTEITASNPRRDPDAENGGLLSAAVIIPIFVYPEE